MARVRASRGFAMGIEGLDELQAALTKAERAIVHDAQIAAMNKIAPMIIDAARANLPQGWLLGRSLTHNIVEKRNRVDMIVGPSKEQEINGQNPGKYGRWHESGYGGGKGTGRNTGKNNWGKWRADPANRGKRPTKARRFMRKAFSQLKDTMLDIIRGETTKAVNAIKEQRATP